MYRLTSEVKLHAGGRRLFHTNYALHGRLPDGERPSRGRLRVFDT